MTKYPTVYQSYYCYFICTYNNRYDGWCHYHSKDTSEVDLTECPKVLENNMLKNTIGRNEAYIDRLTHRSIWSNNSFMSKEFLKENSETSNYSSGTYCKEKYLELMGMLDDYEDEIRRLNESRDELINENRHIKNTIQMMLINERTNIGKNVLKQLWDAINGV